MLVRPHPGANRTNVIDALRQVHTDAVNARNAHGDVNQRYHQYMTWAGGAARRLRNQISTADIDRLVLTRTYWRLQSTPVLTVPVLDLIDLELEERATALEEAFTALERHAMRWVGSRRFVVPDTSVFIQHPQKLKDLDLAANLGIGDRRLHLLIPLAVVDELDSLKKEKNQHVRWRAGHTLGKFDEVFTDPSEIAVLRPPGPSALDGSTPRGEVTIELVFDPPGHIRLPIADEEIIDRALAVRDMAKRPVTLVTFDTGQSTRARMAGLPVVKLSAPLGEEPPRR